MPAKTSDTIKAILSLCGKTRTSLAEAMNMTPQSMYNKMVRDSWSCKDLQAVAEFTGCKLAFILPDGQQLVLDSTEE